MSLVKKRRAQDSSEVEARSPPRTPLPSRDRKRKGEECFQPKVIRHCGSGLNLLNLPVEVLERILFMVDGSDLVRLESVCKWWSAFQFDFVYFHHCIRTDIEVGEFSPDRVDYKRLYHEETGLRIAPFLRYTDFIPEHPPLRSSTKSRSTASDMSCGEVLYDQTVGVKRMLSANLMDGVENTVPSFAFSNDPSLVCGLQSPARVSPVSTFDAFQAQWILQQQLLQQVPHRQYQMQQQQHQQQRTIMQYQPASVNAYSAASFPVVTSSYLPQVEFGTQLADPRFHVNRLMYSTPSS